MRSLKKVVSMFLLTAMFIAIGIGSASALTQRQLDDYRKEMKAKLDATQYVTCNDLISSDSYKSQIVKLQGVVKGIDETSVLLVDPNGNYFCIQRISYYRLNMNTEYLISGTYIGYKENTRMGDQRVTMVYLSVEDAHLPFMSEYGL